MDAEKAVERCGAWVRFAQVQKAPEKTVGIISIFKFLQTLGTQGEVACLEVFHQQSDTEGHFAIGDLLQGHLTQFEMFEWRQGIQCSPPKPFVGMSNPLKQAVVESWNTRLAKASEQGLTCSGLFDTSSAAKTTSC